MTTFLEHVAQDILQKYGTDLSHIAVVFPNKRASLFLNDALARLAGHPIWSPAYITISELFRQHSPLQVVDNIKLICDLHHVYTKITGYDETLDHFYGWGQLLLTDFDDIDKNMAPAKQVFTNLRDIHELDDVSYLTEEQRAIIRKFFGNFSDDHNSELKERFLRLWSNMGTIYQEYNDHLRRQGLAYEGALYRQVAEDDSLSFDHDRYLFVGFNLLQQVEQRLFKNLCRQGKARFYWDYDHYYMKAEAGRYISQYISDFPNELNSNDAAVFDQFRQPKDITFISAPTENIQARYATQWLRENNRIADGRRTAIVLCDEALLGTTIHCLPPEVEHVNVTTGYPLQQAPVASLIQLLLNLHTLGYDRQRRRFRPRYVNAVLRHPYAKYLDREQLLYTPATQKPALSPAAFNAALLHHFVNLVTTLAKVLTPPTEHPTPFTAEALFRTYTLLNRLAGLVESGDLAVETITLQRLVTQLVQQTSVPFHGEPAVGLQIMGVLETRNLDFDHMLLLSANEGNMPRGVNDASFISYSIRKAFGLTTVDNKVAIYAYYFHRLLSRARDITLCFNNATTDGHTGEMSRFMLQLLVESPHPIRQLTLQGGQHIVSQQPRPIAKTPAIVDALRRRFSADLSQHPSPNTPLELRSLATNGTQEHPTPLLTPTAINRYMRCPLQFYYNYVEGLREPENSDTDVIDNRVFGNIFHDAAQLLYEKMMQKSATILAGDIDAILKTKVDIELAVDAAIQKNVFANGQKRHPDGQQTNSGNSQMPELNGQQIINREVIIQYLRLLLSLDRQLCPFTIIGLEKDVVVPYTIHSTGITTTLGGRIDRLDMVIDEEGAEQIRVIDYKTGSRRITPLKTVDDIFDPAQLHNHNDYYLQALLYARLVSNNPSPITPLELRSLATNGTQEHPSPIKVAPALLFIQHAGVEGYDPILRFGQERIKEMATPEGDHFVELLSAKIEEIFDPSIAFVPTNDRNRCANCPYAAFCGQTGQPSDQNV